MQKIEKGSVCETDERETDIEIHFLGTVLVNLFCI